MYVLPFLIYLEISDIFFQDNEDNSDDDDDVKEVTKVLKDLFQIKLGGEKNKACKENDKNSKLSEQQYLCYDKRYIFEMTIYPK